MIATWKVGAGFVRVTICFHLISALLPNLKQRALYLVRKRFNAVGFSSNEIKLGRGFHLRNFDGKGRQARMAHVAATGPVLFSSTSGLQAGVKPALIALRAFNGLFMPIT